MRIMFYGLQNSGATLIALFAGQRPSSVVIPDLWTMYCAPHVANELDVCVKATITSSFSLEAHLEQFRPHHTFLVVRRPVDNAISMRRKVFARHDGTPEEKFRIADEHFVNRQRFTAVVHFEDFIADPSSLRATLAELGWRLPRDAESFPRSALEMERFVWQHAPELYQQVQWGTGQARIEPLSTISLGASRDLAATEFSSRRSPHIHDHYVKRDADEGRPALLEVQHVSQGDGAFQGRHNLVANYLSIFEGHVRAGDSEGALQLATELCEIAHDVPAAYGAKARALEMSGRWEDAERLLLSAIENADAGSPQRFGLREILATSFLRRGRLDDAVRLAENIISSDARSVAAHNLLAEASLRRRLFSEAREQALKSLELDPRNVNARRILAEGLLEEGQLAAARDWLHSALAIAPDYTAARLRLEQLLRLPTPVEETVTAQT